MVLHGWEYQRYSSKLAGRHADERPLQENYRPWPSLQEFLDGAGDMAEYRAIRNALPGDHVRINSTKSMIGHLLGAAGAVEAVAVVQAMQSGVLAYHGTAFTMRLSCDLGLARHRESMSSATGL